MRSTLTLSKPASRAVLMAISACFQLWRRPMSLSMSLLALCTPMLRRLKPSLRSLASSLNTALSGLTSTVTSQSRSTLPLAFSSSHSSIRRLAP